jgi:hypothetical protein
MHIVASLGLNHGTLLNGYPEDPLIIPTHNIPHHRPKKNTPVGSKGTALKQHIDATLGSGNLREAVMLPPGEDLNEWLAVNTVDFYNAISMLYGTLSEYCTPEAGAYTRPLLSST